MTLLAIYSSPTTPGGPGWGEDVSGAIRLGSISGLAGEAEMGAVGQGNVVLDDPDGTVGHSSDGVLGLKQFSFTETACPIGNQRLWTGYVADRRYRRGQSDSLVTGPARKIDVTLTDLNSFLSFRVFAPTADDPTSDFVRPAETDIQRVQAMLTTVDFISTTLFDIGYIPTTGGVAMDAVDYTGQRPIDVLNDCAQASGRNFWILYDEASGHLVLWYDVWTTDGSATKTYDSTLRLTNVVTEHDGITTFAIRPDAVGVLDPSRLVSGVYLPYDGGTAYGTKPATANTYAWRDSVMPSVNVKSSAKASALVTRYLNDNDTEDERISCTVQLPASAVTGIHEGMRIQAWFTHIPYVQAGYSWCRILQRTIRQDEETEEFYWLDLELSPLPFQCPDPTPSQTFQSLSTTATPVGASIVSTVGNVIYFTGGTSAPEVPAPGTLCGWNFPIYNYLGTFRDYAGQCAANVLRVIVVGDGTLAISTAEPTIYTHHLRAQLKYRAPGASAPTVTETQHGVSGDTFTFSVDTALGSHCVNWVDIDEDPDHIDPCGQVANEKVWAVGPDVAVWTLA